MGWLMAVGVGAATGVLSAWGVGGGTLLLLYLSTFAGVEQTVAQGINLLYFLPAAALALPAHLRNDYVDREAVKAAVPAGLLCSGLAAWAATSLDTALLHRWFGVFLIIIGLKELFTRPPRGR